MSWSRIARRIRVPLGFVLAALFLWLAQPTVLSLVIGGLVALLGVGVRAAASGYIAKNEQVTSTGPYAATRNPLYLGSIVLAAGLAVAARSWWIVLAMAILFAAIYLPVIRSEEAYLRAKFSEYDDYARRVPRLLPTFSSARTALRTAGAFSRERYLRHREYNALIGTAALIAALAVKMAWMAR
ncbi:MAG TPA: isoprenylcysteine carboxylmethyltransferase family protein [Terriglobales bacterium]|nr:isoprenylcysteine carboxylmethyltransferase family protein [Terriglobales bacterium]